MTKERDLQVGITVARIFRTAGCTSMSVMGMYFWVATVHVPVRRTAMASLMSPLLHE